MSILSVVTERVTEIFSRNFFLYKQLFDVYLKTGAKSCHGRVTEHNSLLYKQLSMIFENFFVYSDTHSGKKSEHMKNHILRFFLIFCHYIQTVFQKSS